MSRRYRRRHRLFRLFLESDFQLRTASAISSERVSHLRTGNSFHGTESRLWSKSRTEFSTKFSGIRSDSDPKFREFRKLFGIASVLEEFLGLWWMPNTCEIEHLCIIICFFSSLTSKHSNLC